MIHQLIWNYIGASALLLRQNYISFFSLWNLILFLTSIRALIFRWITVKLGEVNISWIIDDLELVYTLVDRIFSFIPRGQVSRVYPTGCPVICEGLITLCFHYFPQLLSLSLSISHTLFLALLLQNPSVAGSNASVILSIADICIAYKYQRSIDHF